MATRLSICFLYLQRQCLRLNRLLERGLYVQRVRLTSNGKSIWSTRSSVGNLPSHQRLSNAPFATLWSAKRVIWTNMWRNSTRSQQHVHPRLNWTTRRAKVRQCQANRFSLTLMSGIKILELSWTSVLANLVAQMRHQTRVMKRPKRKWTVTSLSLAVCRGSHVRLIQYWRQQKGNLTWLVSQFPTRSRKLVWTKLDQWPVKWRESRRLSLTLLTRRFKLVQT